MRGKGRLFFSYCIVLNNQPLIHTTISHFRKDNEQHLKGLFHEILKLCAEAKLVKVGRLFLDGTKWNKDGG